MRKKTYSERGFARSERIGELLHHELALLLASRINNPQLAAKLKRVTIVSVTVSRDHAHADVYYTLLAASKNEAEEEITNALTHANSFLRRELSHQLSLRRVPELHFKFDSSVARGAHLTKLIDEAVQDTHHEL